MLFSAIKTKPCVPSVMAITMTLVGSLLLAGCGSRPSNGGSVTTSDTADIEIIQEQQVQPLTDEEVKQWTNGSSEFIGREATLTGRVFNIEHDGNKHVFQINADPKNYDGNTLIYYEGADPGIIKNDFIRATGTIQKDMPYKNAFGASMSAPLLSASSIEKINYRDAVSPTLASVEPNIVSEQNGYSITVQKIEFAKDETRVYVSLTNNGAGRLTVYDYSAVIIQDGKQINTETNYQANYPSINKELNVGATMEGIVCFPAIEQKGMQIQMNGHSDNYKVDGSELNFIFDITI